MNLVASLDPGRAVTGLFLIVMLQTSIVILVAALLGRAGFRRHAEARHVLWLGALVLVLISPAAAVVSGGVGFALWAIALPVTGHQVTRAHADHRPSLEVARSDPSRLAAELSTGSQAPEIEPASTAMAVTFAELAQVDPTRERTPELNRGRSPLMGALTLLWAIGAFVGLARIALGGARLAAVSQSAHALDHERHGPTLDCARDALGVAALPPVVTSPTVRAPVAVGLFRPWIMLPEGLAESITSDALRDVLVHECALIVRLDAWVGILQRVAGVLFWPHPLVHYASGQLTRAREEVCDNYVLQRGDARGYSRNLLALTERCLPMGAVRPGLGLLWTRWTLADRVAGLLDARRIPMTRTTFRMKIAVWVALTVSGLAAASVRLDRSARADVGPQDKPAEARAVAAPGVWSVDGTVVDEEGRRVASALVRAIVDDGAEDGTKTAADGSFALALGGRHPYIMGVVAEVDDGARIGLVRFENARELGATDPVRLILKPIRPVRVRVNDGARLPVAGAVVEAIDPSFQTHATTGADGTATLRVPADAKVRWVIGLKAGAGFDYFENYRIKPAADFPPLPAELSLTLDGAQTARVNAVDSTGKPVPGVEIGLTGVTSIGKVSYAHLRRSTAAKAMTDHEGIATFDWLPTVGAGVFHFRIATYTDRNYTSQDQPYFRRDGPSKLTAHVLRDTRLLGSVRFADGRPAGGLLIKAEGGPRSGTSIKRAARTIADGSYVLDVPSETSYIVSVADEHWAAPSLSNVFVREGRAQVSLDFALTKGVLLHGQVSEAPDHRPAAGAKVLLTEQGGPVSKDLRRGGLGNAELTRNLTADANGRYHFRVGPGRFLLRSLDGGGTEPLMFEVKNEAEIVHDLALPGPVRDTYFSGVVLAKTPTGDLPLAGAAVRRLRAGSNNSSSPSIADHQGRFRMLRATREQFLYGVSPDQSLAGLMPIPANADNVRLVVARAPRISGRVIDSNGTPQPSRSLIYRIDSSLDIARAGHQQSATDTDDRGLFKVSGAPVGSYVEVSLHYPIKPNSATPRIVVRFEVSDTDSIVIPDMIVPVEKPTK
jgi:beta-lactamase regulating signal transducer with metallopeptidase domain